MAKTKIKLRTCEICGIKKNVKEFSVGKVCDKCETESTSTLREESTDDDDPANITLQKDIHATEPRNHDLHIKMDLLNKRLDRMEALLLGLMELVGKINYDMEISKVDE